MTDGCTTPYGDGRGAEAIENRRNRGFLLRKRVGNSMKMRACMYVISNKELGGLAPAGVQGLGYPTPGGLQKEAVNY
jgi:hypothetical protein